MIKEAGIRFNELPDEAPDMPSVLAPAPGASSARPAASWTRRFAVHTIL